MRSILTGLFFLGLLAGAAEPARGQQLLRLDAGSGEIGFRFEGLRSETVGTPLSAVGEFREWIELPLAGSIVHRRILSYNLLLRPTLQQRSQTEFRESLTSRQLDLAFRARLLSAFPVSLAIGASRMSGGSGGGFGSHRDFARSRLTADLWWRNRLFPMRLAYSRGSTEEVWQNTPSATPFQVANTLRRFRLSASSSKTTLHVERLLYDDRLQDNDLATWNVLGHHVLRWGKGSRIESSFEHTDQRSRFASRRSVWSERLHLQHTRSVASDFTYRRSSTRLDGGSSLSEGFGAELNSRLGRWISAGIRFDRSASRLASTRLRVSSIAPRLHVTVPLPAGARLVGSGSFGYERRERNGSGDELVPALDEHHRVPPSRSFTLDQADVQLESVVVRDGDGSVIYDVGTDYLLVRIGSLVRIDIPPGSRIQVGDPLLVSYRFLLPASDGSSAVRGDYNVSLHMGILNLRHRRSFRGTQGAGAGAVSSVAVFGISDFDETRTTLELRGSTPLGHFDLDAGLRRSDRRRQTTTEHMVGANYAPPAVGTLQASLGVFGNTSRTGPIRVRSVSVNSHITWVATGSLRLRASMEGFTWWQSDSGTQRFLSGSLSLDWRVGWTDVRLRYEHHRRDFVTLNHLNRLSVGIVRRF